MKRRASPISLQNGSYPSWDSVSHLPLKAMVWVLIVERRGRAGWELRYWWVKYAGFIYPTAPQLWLFFMALLVHQHHNQAINIYNGLVSHKVHDRTAAYLGSDDMPYMGKIHGWWYDIHGQNHFTILVQYNNHNTLYKGCQFKMHWTKSIAARGLFSFILM